jgi:Ca-activated chloride channel family protein
MLRFANPWWLLGILAVPVLLWLQHKWQGSRQLKLPFTRLNHLSHSSFWYWFYPGLRALILILLILAIAQPRWGKGVRDLSRKGVDIVLAIDISGSMLAVDFVPQNRLGAAAQVAKNFINSRPNDRFGLVAFSEYALTQSPLTFDHAAMLDQLNKMQVNEKASATAIGMGLAKAVARLRTSNAKSKLVILITDGVSNTGEIDPISAARMAASYDIRVYPIGVGRNGYVDFPVDDPFFGRTYQKVLMELDMETLNQIAGITGTHKASLASDTDQLQEIMNQIDNLEKTQYNLNIRHVWAERFQPLLWLAFILLLAEIVLKGFLQPLLPEL